MPRLLLMEAKWEGKIEVTDKLKKYLEKQKPKTIALFASIQFLDIQNFIKQLEKMEIKINTTKAKRTDAEIQILGCDCYSDSFKKEIIQESDLVLYVGDGLFHPKALLLSQIKNKDFKLVTIFDPISNQIKELTKETIQKQIQRYKRNLKMFIHSKSVGLLVTIKPGQQYFVLAKRLKDKLKEQGKKAYIFVDDTFNLNNLENYSFVKAWVNTACPRIGTDDIVNVEQPIINLKDAFNPIKALEEIK